MPLKPLRNLKGTLILKERNSNTCSSPHYSPKSRTPQMYLLHWRCEHQDCRDNVQMKVLSRRAWCLGLLQALFSPLMHQTYSLPQKTSVSTIFPISTVFLKIFTLCGSFAVNQSENFDKMTKYIFARVQILHPQWAPISLCSLRRFDLTFIYLDKDAWKPR